MGFDHDQLVAFAQKWGLLYFLALSAGVAIYALWPPNRKRFDRAKHSVLDKDDRPDGARHGKR